jgi:signal transduction histidine kinase/CheY-like chemotaxis protein
MTPELRLRRYQALLSLLERLNSAMPSEPLAEALDTLLDASSATAAVAFDRDTAGGPSAERRLQPELGARPVKLLKALAALAERSLSTTRAVRLADIRRDVDGIEGAEELATLGAHAALAVPILGERSVEGVLVLLFADSAMLDAETLGYIEGIAQLSALALERDRGNANEESVRQELGEAGRSATIALMTASVAQELRAPAAALALQHQELLAIAEQLSLLAGTDDPALSSSVSELCELASEMGAAIQRVGQSVDLLGARSRRDPGPTSLQLGELVREALALTRPQLDRLGVLVVVELDADCSTVGRRDHLTQVVATLLLNAADAAQITAPPRIWLRLVAEPSQVLLTVEDNGPGVARADVGEIFKRTYSTKHAGHGGGLGLKVCSEVVTAHGGHIEVAERPGGGACFRVHLPRAENQPSPRLAQPQRNISEPDPSDRHSIFLIDDDPVFARTLQRALRPHEVRTAGSASEAEIALLDPGYEPDLVVCDVLLPGANGDVLHARIVERRPGLAARFVFVTGGGLAESEADYIRASGLLTLLKPLDVRALLELLNRRPEAAGTVRTLTQSEHPGPALR